MNTAIKNLAVITGLLIPAATQAASPALSDQNFFKDVSAAQAELKPLSQKIQKDVAASQAVPATDKGPAFAEKDGAAQTPFDALKSYYDQGRAPSIKEVTGWFSGRCFDMETPSVPENELLVGGAYQAPTAPDDGPLFPPHPATFKVFSLTNWSLAPNAYDSPSPENIQDVIAWLSQADSVAAASIHDGSLESTNSDDWTEHQVRKYGPYFITRVVTLKDDADAKLKAGQIEVICYSFRKVHD